MRFALTDEERRQEMRRTAIAGRCKAVADLAKSFASFGNLDALTDLARTVKALGEQIEEHREDVRRALAGKDPMGARREESTL